MKVWEGYKTGNVYNDKVPGEITKIYKDGFGVKVIDGEVIFTIIQPEGRRKMKAIDFINGYHGNLIGKIIE